MTIERDTRFSEEHGMSVEPQATTERQKVMTDKPQINPLLKLALDIGPLLLFVAAIVRFDIFVATATFMVAIVIALGVSYALTRRLPIMPVITTVIVLVFGSLTLFLHDNTFIKIKPTIIYALFGSVLIGGLIFDRPLLATVLDSSFHLTEEGWRKLTLRWAGFFFALAVLNEIVWRTQSDATWGYFKLMTLVLTFIFAALQYPLLVKHALEPAPKD
jgi:intracellular septation protein